MLSCVLLLIALLSVAHAWSHRALQLDANSFEGSIHRMPNFFAFIFDSTKTTHLDTLDGAIARLFAEHPEAWSTCLIGAYDIGAPGNLQALDRVLPKLDVTSASTSSLKYLGTNTPKWSSTYKMDKDHLYDFILKRMKLAVAPTVIPKNEQENLPAHLRSMQVMEKVQYDYHRIHAMAQLAYNQPEKIDEILEEVEQWKDRIAADKQWGFDCECSSLGSQDLSHFLFSIFNSARYLPIGPTLSTISFAKSKHTTLHLSTTKRCCYLES
jgi:hypothetical protein